MIELLRTNDVVFLGWVEALLRDAGFQPLIMDQHASVMDGSISAIQRRLMIHTDDESRARRVLIEAGAIEP